MWFLLSLLALFTLVARRSTEKHVAGNISSLGMAWLQQAFALPFIVVTLLFSRFYWPSELSSRFWLIMTAYVFIISVDIYCYFKALSLADVSYVAPLMTVAAIGNIMGAYVILQQEPSIYGLIGAGLIVFGATMTYGAKRKDIANRRSNKLALLFILLLVCVRSVGGSIEVLMLRESNPATFNFYSSVLTVPFIFLASVLIIYTNRTDKYSDYWKKLRRNVSSHQGMLVFIGATYTINMLATYQAKLVGPNAGYVTAVKSASVLPMVLIGFLLFKEKVVGVQWLGLLIIGIGLLLLALN